MRATKQLGVLLAGCAATLPLPVLAQTDAAPPEQTDASAPTRGLEEIVVTAQKRAESLQSVPISVTALTGAAVDNLKATNLQQLQGAIPNIQINTFTNTPNNAVFTIRGIGVIDPDPFAGNTVSIVQDGVPQYFSMGALLDLFDVDRIEVLRGPQGTLFGANTTGGVVNVTTRQPTGTFGLRAEATYGNWDRLDLKAALDFPIVDGLLAGKVAYMHTERDSFYTNIVDGKDLGSRNVDVVRGYLMFTPDPDLKVTLSGEYGATRNGAPVIVNGAFPGDAIYVPGGTTGPGQVLPMYPSPCQPGQPCKAPDKYFSAQDYIPDQSHMDTYRATLTVDWSNTPIGDITAVTGYKQFRLAEYTDNDAVVGLGIDTYRKTKGWQFSQELRTSVDLSDAVNLLVGGFYLKTHYDHFMNLRLDFAVPGLRQYQPQNQDNWSGSLFAQTFIDLTDALRLQAGIRYTHEKTDMIAGVDNYLNPSGVGTLCTGKGSCGDDPLGGFRASGKKSWDKLGWKVGLDYQIERDVLLYGYYARGFKSGGFVGRIAAPQDLGPFGPETVDTFEAGFKADFLDRRLRTNLSVFYTNYKDMQVAQNYILPDGITIGTSIFNAAKSEIKGAEFEVTALPTEGLTLTGSVAYLDAKYKNFLFFDSFTGGFIDLAGERLQNSPKWSATAGATYEVPVGPGRARANVLYTYTASKFLQGLTNPPTVRIQPTNYVHANLSWTPDDSFWSIELWGRNLLDKRYIEAATLNTGLFNQVGYAPPREYGATVKINF